MALLARLTHEQLTVPRLGELLSIVETSPLVREADSDAAANAREIRRVYDRAVKLPAELVTVGELPRNASGKVIKQQLAQLVTETPPASVSR